jgi:hypothetical protein
MIRKPRLLKLFGSIAVATSIAVVGARTTAHASTFITDTLGGTGHAQAGPDVIGRYLTSHGQQVQGYRFITDTLGGNGRPYNAGAYVPGGASQQVAQAIQSLGKAPVPSPAAVQSVKGGSFLRWSNAWIDGVWAACLLLAAGAAAARTRQRRLAMA